jgi:hypothetical protein
MDSSRRSRRSRRGRRGRGGFFWILLLVVMLFLIVAGFLLYWERIKDFATTSTVPGPTEVVQEEPTTAEESSSTLEEEPTIAEEAIAGSPEEENGVRVLVSVVSAEGVGLSVLEDGQLVYDQVASPGFLEEFQGEEAVTVTAAEGGAVQVGVGGEDPEPLGASGEWTTRTFTAESQS